MLGDLDHDGIKDFVIHAHNDKGCQCVQVIKGKDLSVRYSLLKDGVIYENEEDSFSVTGIDYDNDGVDDLVVGEKILAMLVTAVSVCRHQVCSLDLKGSRA